MFTTKSPFETYAVCSLLSIFLLIACWFHHSALVQSVAQPVANPNLEAITKKLVSAEFAGTNSRRGSGGVFAAGRGDGYRMGGEMDCGTTQLSKYPNAQFPSALSFGANRSVERN